MGGGDELQRDRWEVGDRSADREPAVDSLWSGGLGAAGQVRDRDLGRKSGGPAVAVCGKNSAIIM